MKGGRCSSSSSSCLGWFLAKCCCCGTCKDGYSVSSNENGGKSDSVANLQPQPSLNSIQSSPGPKRSTNTLKKWLTSPVRRLNSGKAESNIKKQKKVRDGRKSFDLGSPKTGDETTPQGDSADESKKGWGEDEPDEESHTPLPPPMKIFDNDPAQDEMRRLSETKDQCSFQERVTKLACGLLQNEAAFFRWSLPLYNPMSRVWAIMRPCVQRCGKLRTATVFAQLLMFTLTIGACHLYFC